jgi:hypothetical protein
VVSAGSSAVFNVRASGATSLGYQWRRNGGNLTGQNSPNLTLANVQTADEGNYDVVVTTASGSVTSLPASLTVTALPQITVPPASQTVFAGTNVQFAVTATATGALTYQWAHNGAAIEGATGNALPLTSVRAADGGAYTVTVSNAAGSVTSPPAVLTVIEIVSVPTFTAGVFQFNLTVPAGREAIVEVSTDFINWTPLSPSPIGSGNVSDPSAGSSELKFYRVRLQ